MFSSKGYDCLWEIVALMLKKVNETPYNTDCLARYKAEKVEDIDCENCGQVQCMEYSRLDEQIFALCC